MFKPRIALIESKSSAMPELHEQLKESFQITVIHSALDALAEILKLKCDLLIVSEELEDLAGPKLSCLLKTTPATSSLPIILVFKDTESMQSIWANCALADYVVDKNTLKADLDKLPEVIASIVNKEESPPVTADSLKKYPFLTGSYSRREIKKSFQNLLDGFITERLVHHFTRHLITASADRTTFSQQLLDFLFRFAGTDLAGICIASPAGSWSIFHASKPVTQKSIEELITECTAILGLVIPPSTALSGNISDGTDADNTPLEIRKRLISGKDGALYGVLIGGWQSHDNMAPAALPIFAHLSDYLSLVLKTMIAEETVFGLKRQQQYLSSIDAATGLYNLEFFMGFLQQQLLFSSRQKLPIGLALVDIDNFSLICQKQGQDYGNAALQSISQKLSSTIRSSDLIARYSTDQLVIILPNTDSSGLAIIGEKLRQAVEELQIADPNGKSITASVGMASFNLEDITPETILRDAKVALSKAKNEGKNKVSM